MNTFSKFLEEKYITYADINDDCGDCGTSKDVEKESAESAKKRKKLKSKYFNTNLLKYIIQTNVQQ